MEEAYVKGQPDCQITDVISAKSGPGRGMCFLRFERPGGKHARLERGPLLTFALRHQLYGARALHVINESATARGRRPELNANRDEAEADRENNDV
ncbi:Protein kinase domain-containing protein [Operophtera brumata]|uniref:Protein kinase domain-containing protein n=1 Tax=Operophtera brumata TaxID=104452 RepID=A0A0L7L993_OPEBR|nr:Protein kinase domain-containing protein [Operophtera brumata]